MIKIKKSDTLIDIVNIINSSTDDKIVLDFPFWHQVLHSYLSLKIIKNKCLKKELIIITNDINAKKIWKRIWINYSLKSWIELTDKQDILKHNFTFFSFLRFQLKKYAEEFINLFNKGKFEQLQLYNISKNTKSRLWFFTSILFLSVFIFTFIFYFAVNKTIVNITPETTIKLRSKNIVFTESDNNPSFRNNIVTIKKISSKTSLEETFWTSWVKITNNKKSTWKATLYNYLEEEVILIKNTRLLTKEWLLFQTINDTTIEKAKKDENWIIAAWKQEVLIEAKALDSSWNIIWKRWDIGKWVELTLPWLDEEEKLYIYWNTSTEIVWGTDDYVKLLTKEDIDNWYKIFEEKLKQKSIKEIKQQIKKQNISNNITSEILWIDNIIKYSDLDIREEWRILKEWQQRDNFTLSWSIIIYTYIYNKDTVVNKMRSIIKDSVIEWDEKITFINHDSLRVSNIVYKQEHPYEIKATLEIEVFITHNFDNEKNYYVEKLKNEILWLKKEDAIKVLLNNNKISDVNIDIRPFFIKNVSNILNNIEFKLNN